ncbi:MAG: ATP-binding cassette domain-containing protein [Nitrospirae bacterium]|nr:ATP-binding cassette domain-containing protein [Nitrospirota bacterium]
MIEFDRVSFSYGSNSVLKDLSFSIGFEERVAILGGSGDGKTTILKIILGLVRPDSGRVLIDGEDMTDRDEDGLRESRMKFSMVFQEGALFDSLTVKENVAFCLREYDHLSEEDVDARVRHILGTVGIEHAMDLMPEELSGGMHRRVALARSLAACDPKMFLYDEPTTGLDPINADNICRLIVDLAREGTGFIVVTHKVVDALKVAKRFMFLKNGALSFEGSSAELMGAADPDIRRFISELRYGADAQGAEIQS